MITAADEIYIDFSTSCTRDVAVAKMLGWMQGPIRRKWIDVTVDGISEDQLPYLHRMDEPIKDQLLELREVAQQKLYKAFADDDKHSTDASRELLSAAADEVDRHSQTIYLAAQYFYDIDDELANQESSKLRVDLVATKTPDNPYITLSSLDRWAKAKYGISLIQGGIIEATESESVGSPDDGLVNMAPTSAAPSIETPTSAAPSIETPAKVDQLKANIVAANARKEKYVDGKSEVSLLVTCAFLVEAFVEQVQKFGDEKQKKKFLRPNENPKIWPIAEHLEALMEKANGGVLLTDQQSKSVSNRLSDAMKAKAEVLPIK